MAKLNAEQLADIWNSLQNGRISVGDTKRLFEHIDSLEAEIAALREPMACGHPKAALYPWFGPASSRSDVYCTACEHERLERTAALRELETVIQDKYDRLRVTSRISSTDRSALDEYVREKVDQALDKAAAIAQRHTIPGHFVQAPSCIAIANAILAEKSANRRAAQERKT